jgi:predicted lipid-binding transport protein (Tim44 family)
MWNKKRIVLLIGAVVLTGVLTNRAFASTELFVYPEKGQSQDQTEKDKFECYGWAKGQSGFDPMAPPTASQPPPQQQARGSVAGGAAKGGVGGGLLGAGIGAIAGDAKKGAAIGALSGGVMGGMRRNRQHKSDRQAQEQWAQQQAGQYQQQRSLYNRAYAACLEGRGYSVK